MRVWLTRSRIVPRATADRVATRNYPDHGCDRWIDRSGSSKRTLSQEIGDVSATNGVRTAENKVAKCRALISCKKKRLVANDGTTDCAPKLITLDLIRSHRRRKVILRVENRIAHELEQIPVEVVGARFGDHVHHATRILPVLRAVIARLYAELLERVGERKWLIDVGVLVYVVTAVELVADGILAGAIGRIMLLHLERSLWLPGQLLHWEH